MDIEFHYYITFILSRKAGYSADDAYTIAYSSQYTDDNKKHYYVNYPDGHHFLNEISQTIQGTHQGCGSWWHALSVRRLWNHGHGTRAYHSASN